MSGYENGEVKKAPYKCVLVVNDRVHHRRGVSKTAGRLGRLVVR